jgi:ferredoxin
MAAAIEMTSFEQFLVETDESAWRQAIKELLPEIHEVDRNATQVWFYFFPLTLARVFERADDADALAKKLLMQGKFRLKDQIDSSHGFLYGHRYWAQIKRVVEERAAGAAASRSLTDEIRAISARAADELKIDRSLTMGMAAIGLMTLTQVGLDAFKSAPGKVSIDDKLLRRTPEQILKSRAKDDSQGIFGFLRTADKQWTICFNEADETARVKAYSNEELASAAARDKRPWHERDERCTINEGPIPVQCRSAACGTCWVGVLGGAEKLSAVAPLESKRIKLFGYIDTDEPRPLIRLACQAQTTGAVSIVIPPWNGFYGKYLRQLKENPQAQPDASSTAAEN